MNLNFDLIQDLFGLSRKADEMINNALAETTTDTLFDKTKNNFLNILNGNIFPNLFIEDRNKRFIFKSHEYTEPLMELRGHIHSGSKTQDLGENPRNSNDTTLVTFKQNMHARMNGDVKNVDYPTSDLNGNCFENEVANIQREKLINQQYETENILSTENVETMTRINYLTPKSKKKELPINKIPSNMNKSSIGRNNSSYACNQKLIEFSDVNIHGKKCDELEYIAMKEPFKDLQSSKNKVVTCKEGQIRSIKSSISNEERNDQLKNSSESFLKKEGKMRNEASFEKSCKRGEETLTKSEIELLMTSGDLIPDKVVQLGNCSIKKSMTRVKSECFPVSNELQKSSQLSLKILRKEATWKRHDKILSNVTNYPLCETYNLRSIKKLFESSHKARANSAEKENNIAQDINMRNKLIHKKFKTTLPEMLESKYSIIEKSSFVSNDLNKCHLSGCTDFKDTHFKLKENVCSGMNAAKVVNGNEIVSMKRSRKVCVKFASIVKSKKINTSRIRHDAAKKSVALYKNPTLKVNVEEKRRLREMRVQQTKERRERLEKEREAKIRLNEQRLKHKFRNHEEMPKEKTEKFKIKSRDMKQKSASSTSSEDSKEGGAKDKEKFCRNAVDRGQKESNVYDIILPKKSDPASAEGNVGFTPEIAKEQNAIFVSCGKTPAEFLGSDNYGRIKRDEEKIQGGARFKDFEKFAVMILDTKVPDSCLATQYTAGTHLKEIENNAVCSKSKSPNKPSKKRSKRKPGSSRGNNLKTPKSVNINCTVSEINLCRTYVVKKQNSYLLRSSQKKQKKNMYLKEYTKTSSTRKVCDAIGGTPRKGREKNRKACCKYKISGIKKDNSNLCASLNTKPCSHTRNSVSTRSQKCLLPDSLKVNTDDICSKSSDKKMIQSSGKISELEESIFMEMEFNKKSVPLWATNIYLQQELLHQYCNPPKLEHIFGEASIDPVDLVAIFGMNKPKYHLRTSSHKW